VIHLGNVELEPPHHAAERLDDGGHLLELEVEGARLDGAVLERLSVATGDESGLEPETIHNFASI
jgi:hypothetical protein